MKASVNCPICLAQNQAQTDRHGELRTYSCAVCGTFSVSGTALIALAPERDELTPLKRAVLSYRIRERVDGNGEVPVLTSDRLRDVVETGALPSPGQQATNLIRFVGNAVAATGRPFPSMPMNTYASIGSPSQEAALRIAMQLVEQGVLLATNGREDGSPWGLANIEPSLKGWDRYEAEKTGSVSGKYGFVALKFNDAVLEPFLRDVIKPAVRSIGFELVDMRDVAEAGLIDNVMRARIRDAAFVLADLTHANHGAYWEAGFAEGLGKPVLYLCQKEVFEGRGTHFDTNHCTTIMWDPLNCDSFQEELVATLRRSLGLFAA